MNHLDEARDAISDASECAPGPVHTQLNSIEEGVFEEEGGETTQDDPGPKIDRVVELTEKLQGLDDEVDDAETRTHIERAIDHLQAYTSEHPRHD